MLLYIQNLCVNLKKKWNQLGSHGEYIELKKKLNLF